MNIYILYTVDFTEAAWKLENGVFIRRNNSILQDNIDILTIFAQFFFPFSRSKFILFSTLFLHKIEYNNEFRSPCNLDALIENQPIVTFPTSIYTPVAVEE